MAWFLIHRSSWMASLFCLPIRTNPLAILIIFRRSEKILIAYHSHSIHHLLEKTKKNHSTIRYGTPPRNSRSLAMCVWKTFFYSILQLEMANAELKENVRMSNKLIHWIWSDYNDEFILLCNMIFMFYFFRSIFSFKSFSKIRLRQSLVSLVEGYESIQL